MKYKDIVELNEKYWNAEASKMTVPIGAGNTLLIRIPIKLYTHKCLVCDAPVNIPFITELKGDDDGRLYSLCLNELSRRTTSMHECESSCVKKAQYLMHENCWEAYKIFPINND